MGVADLAPIMAQPMRSVSVTRSISRPPVTSSMRGAPSPDSYVLTEILGAGSYATVYKGYSKQVPRDVVAVKCVDRRRLSSTSVENLITEIEVMKQLKHKHIVRLLDFEWNTTHIFLVMEYCNGGDLSSFIHSRVQLRESTARKFLRELALALQYLRSKGVAHLDLKPQNILLSSTSAKPTLKIGDFGMAQHLNAGDHAESFRGSPLYMAPEIMLGQEYDAKVDLWSVGVILYETLFGVAPFASNSLEELHLKVLDDRPVEIPTDPVLSSSCRDLLHGLLQREPNERISFENFFNHKFIDLEHMPSAECLPKARELVKLAVVKDSEGKFSSALNYYCQALDYFIPALDYEEGPIKEQLKHMVEQYVERAEEMKSLLKTKRPTTAPDQQRTVRLLDELQIEVPSLQEVLQIAKEADKCELEQSYKKALELYKDAVEKLLPVIEMVSSREGKKLLSAQAELYLQRAEDLTTISEKKVPRPRPAVPSPSASLVATATEKCKVQ